MLSENLTAHRSHLKPSDRDLSLTEDEDDLEAISRNDALNTPITGADMILSWPIFPKNKPFSTFPMAAYSPKPDRFHPGVFKL